MNATNEQLPAREIMTACYKSEACQAVLKSASERCGSRCRFQDNPIDGVLVVRDDDGNLVIVELTNSERALLFAEIGKAFAKLVRL